MPKTSKQPLTPIGTTEYIDFPDEGIFAVPAKIDTGADSSAVWASDIHLQDDKLSFVFFAPGSAFYQGIPVVTSAFKTTVIKNSFGHTEPRYKVRISVSVGSHRVKRWFSLADRSRSSYPVLLGKSFLKNRFLVDVSRKLVVSSQTQNNRVMILANNVTKNSQFFDKVQQACQTDMSFSCATYNSLLFTIDGLRSTVINGADSDADMASYGLVYLKNHDRQPEMAAATAEYLGFKARNFIDKELANYVSTGKLSEAMRLASHDIATPPSIVAHSVVLLGRYQDIAQTLGVPFVLKEIHSNRGKYNYLIQDETDFRTILQSAEPEHIYMAQKQIPNDGYIRAYVFGREVQLAVLRTPHPHADRLKSHLNKPAGGSNATKIDLATLDQAAINLVVTAADCMNRQIAGVDIIKDKHTGQWYVLEVNNAPQLYSGSLTEDKVVAVAQFFDKELDR